MRFTSRILGVVTVLYVGGYCQMPMPASPHHRQAQPANDAHTFGVVVEAVEPGSTAAKAGLCVGDVLQEYGGRSLRTVFKFMAAQENTVAASITLKGLRSGQPLLAQLPMQSPGIPSPDVTPNMRVHPQWSNIAQALYQAGQTSILGGRIEEGVVSWRNAIVELENSGDAVEAGWLCWRTGEAYSVRGDWKQAQQWQEHAWKNVKSGNDAAAQTCVLHSLGEVWEHQGDLARAFDWYEQARKLNIANQNVFWQANDLDSEGDLAFARQKWNEANKLYEQALTVCQPQAPAAWQTASILYRLGKNAEAQANHLQAQKRYEDALAIIQKQTPDSWDAASICFDMGLMEFHQENWTKGIEYSRQALILFRRKAPNSREVMQALLNMGQAAEKQDDLSHAYAYLEEALHVIRNHKTDAGAFTDITVEATCCAHLGILALRQGHSEDAQKYAQAAIAIYETQKPVLLDMVAPLGTLGTLALNEGDLPQSQNYYKYALEICKRYGSPPGQTLDVLRLLDGVTMLQGASSNAQLYIQRAAKLLKSTSDPAEKAALLDGLSLAAVQQGRWKLAQQYAQQLLTIQQRFSPASSSLIEIYALLGYIEAQQKDSTNAQLHFQQMLALTQKFAPDSLEEANARAFLGHVLLVKRDYEGALKQFEDAVTIVEARRQRLANPENRAFLLEQHSVPFIGMMQAQIALNQKEQAFETLERARARSLVDLIRERKPSASMPLLPDTPPESAEQHKIIQQRGELSQQLLVAAAGPQQAKSNELREKIQALDAKQRELETAIRQSSPHYAGLNYPKPLSFVEARQTLDDGTLLLAYALGAKQSYLFVVTNKTELRIFPLAVGEEALGREVKELNDALKSKGSYLNPARLLYRQLVAPAWKEIAASRRILLCPDGVLNTLAFAALVTSPPDKPGTPGQPATHLVEAKPLHVIASLSLYRELRQMQVSRSGKILALADPDATKSGLHLPPTLPTRQQITDLKKLYGNRVEAYTGKQATSAIVRQQGLQASIVHFACHGVLENGDPLSSALALSSDGADKGLLTAAGILRLHLPADLVMLSACETGLGKQTQFEGVVGLTRAFQYAGARSVGVSLWQVDADSANTLMNHFYTEYKAGVSKDVALQRAQVAILRDKKNRGWQHPYFWAAFQIVGDWK